MYGLGGDSSRERIREPVRGSERREEVGGYSCRSRPHMTVPLARCAYAVYVKANVHLSVPQLREKWTRGAHTCSSASMSPMRSPAVTAADGAPLAAAPATSVDAAPPAAAAAAAAASPSIGRRRRRRRRGSVMNLGRGRASRSSATFVAACRACRVERLSDNLMDQRISNSQTMRTSIRSMTPRSSLACKRNCSPSARTRTTCFRLI